MLKEVNPDPKAAARRTLVVAMVIGPVYAVDVATGSEPSKVYLMVAVGSAHVIETVCALG